MLVAGTDVPRDARFDEAGPVHGQGERLADAHVVERLLAHVEAEVLERQRGHGPERRARGSGRSAIQAAS